MGGSLGVQVVEESQNWERVNNRRSKMSCRNNNVSICKGNRFLEKVIYICMFFREL